MLYGLFKQAEVGDRDVDPPSKMDLVASAKYAAWGKFIGLSRKFAAVRYCEVVHHFAKGGTSSFAKQEGGMKEENNEEDDSDADIVYDDDDSGEEDEDGLRVGSNGSSDIDDDSDGVPHFTGMGMRPSTLDHTGNDISSSSDSSPESSLRDAASRSDLPAIRRALDAGADPSYPDETGQTALHFAADRACLSAVEMLVEARADVGAVDEDGVGVLQSAVLGGGGDGGEKDMREVVKMLLKAGADPDAEDGDGESARSCAAEQNENGGDGGLAALFASR